MPALQSFGAAVFVDMSGLLDRIKGGQGITVDSVNGDLIISATGASAPSMPATAPTGSFDESSRVFTLAHALGVTELLVSIDSAAFVQATTLAYNFGPGARGLGYIRAKVKAATGRLESPVYSSPAYEAVNNAPVVTSLTSSEEEANAGQTVVLSVSATDSDDSVASIKVFDGGAQIGTVNGTSGSLSTPALTAGNHYFKAAAVDSRGKVGAFSAIVEVKVNAVYDTTLDSSVPEGGGVAFAPSSSQRFKLNALAQPSALPADMAITHNGTTSYVTFPGDYLNSSFEFTGADGSVHTGFFTNGTVAF